MLSTATASPTSALAARPPSDERLEEMKVTFDSDELAAFFDGFDALDLGAGDESTLRPLGVEG